MIESIVTDIVTFGSLSAGMWFNFTYCGNSKIMSGFFITTLFLKSLNIFKKGWYTVDEASEKIEEIKGANRG